MSQRTQIDDPQGVQDQKATSVLRSIKSIIDTITGRKQGTPLITTLGPNATLPGVINKVNEIINRLQG